MFEIKLFICIKIDLALNNPQRLICHNTHTKRHWHKHTDAHWCRHRHKNINVQINTEICTVWIREKECFTYMCVCVKVSEVKIEKPDLDWDKVDSLTVLHACFYLITPRYQTSFFIFFITLLAFQHLPSLMLSQLNSKNW